MPKWEYLRNRREWVCEHPDFGTTHIEVKPFNGKLSWKKCPHWDDCKYGCTFGFVNNQRLAVVRIISGDQFQRRAGWKEGRKRDGMRGKAVK